MYSRTQTKSDGPRAIVIFPFLEGHFRKKLPTGRGSSDPVWVWSQVFQARRASRMYRLSTIPESDNSGWLLAPHYLRVFWSPLTSLGLNANSAGLALSSAQNRAWYTDGALRPSGPVSPCAIPLWLLLRPSTAEGLFTSFLKINSFLLKLILKN